MIFFFVHLRHVFLKYKLSRFNNKNNEDFSRVETQLIVI
jgi:hypothetical protein